ncbi:MAG: methionyl-tRNA formyltransferase [Lachnospiraceae bacterium]|nr:methionyl-tRNA formyltransferase [Lachnospiraceae bacterium]
MKIVFMGTPDFSVGALNALLEAGHEIAAVVTQPDKPKGRKMELQYPPVKEAALKHHLRICQPERVKKNEEFYRMLTEISPDVIVVVAFGQILPKEILTLPRYGCINIHASLLPRYRGAAPIQWAVINGEEKTGVTTMQMNEGLDTGDILEKTEIILGQKETGGSLFDKLSKAGAELIVQTLSALEQGKITPVRQDDSQSSYAGMLDKKLGCIDFSNSAVSIERLIRGLNPWPSAYTFLNGKTLKLWAADVQEEEYEGVCGEIVEIGKDCIRVKTGKGTLVVRELQLEGKKRMDTATFLRGYQLEKGIILNGSK